MRIESGELQNFNSNIESSSDFTVKASAKAFDILSSGIYSDKEKAIVRELVCNAYDSHVESGKLDTPFHIHVPNELLPSFYVEDFGLGLSNDQVNHLYTTYFESTKTESNDVIGALGLGSKSPFAYTDTFTVESTYDGVRTSFIAYKDSSGLPVISEVGSIDVDAPNGVKVSVAIDSKDFRTFENKINEVMGVFDPSTYEILNDETERATPEYPEVRYEHENIKFFDNGYNKGIYAIMGNIKYPINLNVLDPDRDDEGAYAIKEAFMNNLRAEIKFDIGELDISASREELGYDVRTVDNINKQIAKIKPFVQGIIRDEIATADSYYEACLKCMKSMQIFSNYVRLSDYEYNGIRLKQTFQFDKKWDWIGINKLKVTSNYNVMRGDSTNIIKIDEASTIFINDIGRGIYKRIQHNYSMYELKRDEACLINFYGHEDDLDDSFIELFEQMYLGGKKVQLLSELKPVPKSERSLRQKTMKSEITAILVDETVDGDYQGLVGVWGDSDEYDLDEGGIYISTSRGTPEYKGFMNTFRALVELDLLDDDMPIYTCPKSAFKFIKKNPKWMSFEEYTKAVLSEIDTSFLDTVVGNASALLTLEYLLDVSEDNIEFIFILDLIRKGNIDTSNMNTANKYLFETMMLLDAKRNIYYGSTTKITRVRSIYYTLGLPFPLDNVKRSDNDVKRMESGLKMLYNQNSILKFLDYDISGDKYEEFAKSVQEILERA